MLYSAAVHDQIFVLYSQIMSEYHDSVQRAHRLSLVREDLLCGTEQVLNEVKLEDILIYLRWLVCHFHSVKRVNHYLRVRTLTVWKNKTRSLDPPL